PVRTLGAPRDACGRLAAARARGDVEREPRQRLQARGGRGDFHGEGARQTGHGMAGQIKTIHEHLLLQRGQATPQRGTSSGAASWEHGAVVPDGTVPCTSAGVHRLTASASPAWMVGTTSAATPASAVSAIAINAVKRVGS